MAGLLIPASDGAATTAAVSANAAILEFQADFRIAYYESAQFPMMAVAPTAINGKSFEFTFYPVLTISTTPLPDSQDVDSSTLTPTKKVMEAQQYGASIGVTELADWQTRSKASRAAARTIGINAGQTVTRLCMEEADRSTNIIRPNDRATDGAVVAGDVLDQETLEEAYNKLERENVPMLEGGLYALVCHADALSDIRTSDKWIEINRYQNSMKLLQNEVGTYQGFRIIRNNLSTIGADGGSANVDLYNTYALGADALAYGEKMAPEIVVTQFDKLNRLTHIGWKWIGVHQILRQESLWVIKHASSRGANT